MATVRTTMEIRERRARVRDLVLDALAAVVALSVGTVVGVFTTGWGGLAAGLGTLLVALAARRLAGRLARARGSAAWDWQAGRHRLLGQPASRVQDLDRRDRKPPGMFG